MPVLESWMLVLPLCTALGCLFGSFTFRHFALGSSAILFAGMAAGAAGAQMPPAIRELGLALFIYSVGSETGGGFLAVLARRGPKLAAVCLATVTAGFAAALLCGLCFGLPPAGIAGLFGGALTSTPALATAMDGLDPAGTVLLTASYGLAYPAGIIGVIVFVRIAARLEGVDVKAEEDALNAQDADPLPARKDGGANPRGTPAPSAGTSPLPVLLVIGAGYALGQLPLPLPGQSSVSLGSAGGILLCAILAAGKGHAGKLPLLPSPPDAPLPARFRTLCLPRRRRRPDRRAPRCRNPAQRHACTGRKPAHRLPAHARVPHALPPRVPYRLPHHARHRHRQHDLHAGPGRRLLRLPPQGRRAGIRRRLPPRPPLHDLHDQNHAHRYCSTHGVERSALEMPCGVGQGGTSPQSPLLRSRRSSPEASSSGGGIKPAGRNTGAGRRIFSNAKRSRLANEKPEGTENCPDSSGCRGHPPAPALPVAGP